MLNATSNITSVVARIRFRTPTSVAKYQPNKTSRPRPAKNVSAGLIGESGNRKAERRIQHVSVSAFSFYDVRDLRFFQFDLYVIGNLQHYGCLFHVRDLPVNARIGHDAVAGLQAQGQALLFLLPFLLRPDQNEIHNNDDEEPERQEIENTASTARTGRSRRARQRLN